MVGWVHSPTRGTTSPPGNGGRRAEQVNPRTGEVYGVLADALTQLGDAAADRRRCNHAGHPPGVASFTRASYDLELHGRVEDARSALERALGCPASPDNVAFCHYYLGELAFNAGAPDEAQPVRQGLLAVPGNVARARHGEGAAAAGQDRRGAPRLRADHPGCRCRSTCWSTASS